MSIDSPQPTFLARPGTGGPNTSSGTLGLTPSLLQKSRRRVGTIGWIVVALSSISAPSQLMMYRAGELTYEQMDANLIGALAAIIIALAVIVLARSGRGPDAAVVWVGLLFQVVLCFVAARATHLVLLHRTGEPSFMTWVTPMIILFPLLVPVGPRFVLLVGFAAAATEPLALFQSLEASGLPFLPSYSAVLINPLAAVAVSWLAARMVHRLQTDIAKARKLGSYQLVERLGAGGMAEVWQAEHALLARSAAVKFVRGDALGGTVKADELLQRFEQEAQATASLRSPHTVQLYDFGRSDEGAFYIVMELLDGMDLQTLVEQFGPQPAERVVHLLRQVCHSLGEAHQAGLIHRDIKPANIFVCRYGQDDDFIKVLDFGLVKSHDSSADAGVTQMGAVPGTPAYMAPETALGQPIDGRSDLYALGCVAYYLLTGTLVFQADTPVAMVAKHINNEPDPPSKRTELEIPVALESLVLACLAKDPAQRPSSARDLADRLLSCQVADWSDDDAKRWWSTHRPS